MDLNIALDKEDKAQIYIFKFIIEKSFQYSQESLDKNIP